MRNRLIAAFLLLSLVISLVGCATENTPENTTTAPIITTAPTTEPTTEPITEPTETEPEVTVPYIEASAKIGVTGDVLVHPAVYSSCHTGDGNYDFNEIFEAINPYYKSYDYMIANLEVTFGGPEKPYSGYPIFNCPDPMADALKNAGVDMVLTANNHTYDTRTDGMLRTLDVLDKVGLEYLGTRKTVDDPTYLVKDINGIKIGMACYTYETTWDFSDGKKSLNGIILTEEASKLVSSFRHRDLEDFYDTVEADLAGMKDNGAEFTMVYIHWGDEYKTSPNALQKKLAQQLCNLGVDIIVGGHPHVLQPFATLTSDSGHTTYCLYSTGNAVSNQRRDLMGNSAPNGHTEDGIIFEVEFEKWNDGSVKIAGIGAIPTWVDRPWNNGDPRYTIIPLDYRLETWKNFCVPLDEDDLLDSYDRTMDIIGEGLNAIRQTLGLMEIPTEID